MTPSLDLATDDGPSYAYDVNGVKVAIYYTRVNDGLVRYEAGIWQITGVCETRYFYLYRLEHSFGPNLTGSHIVENVFSSQWSPLTEMDEIAVAATGSVGPEWEAE